MKFRALIIFVTPLFFLCCSPEDDGQASVIDEENGIDNEIEEEVAEENMITYTDDVAPILEGNCLSCHGANPINGATNSLNTYELLVDSITLVNERINSLTDPMPRSGLMSVSNREIIAEWIEGGLLEN